MNLQQRLEMLEAGYVDTPLSVQDAMKWFLMLAGERGTGYTSEGRSYTPEEWEWYRENTEEALNTLRKLRRQRR